jgi:hypothetical protein
MHSALLLHACILVCASCMWLSKHLYCCKPMYPALPGSGLTPSTNIYANNTPTSNSSFGNNFPQNAASTSYGSQPASSAYGLSSQGSLDNSPWNAAENSTLKVKITDEYRLAAPVRVLQQTLVPAGVCIAAYIHSCLASPGSHATRVGGNQQCTANI